jgi:lysophospholipase L1-like esterase
MRISAPVWLLCAAAIAGAAPQHFAFGPAPAEYTQVAPDAVYGTASGFGYDLKSNPADGKAFFFSVKEPEGNYRATVQLGDPSAACTTTVKAESRRLMIQEVRTAPGQFVTRQIIVNVRNSSIPPPPANAPGGDAVRLNDREAGVLHWDDKLTFEFIGEHPCVHTIDLEKVDVPTVFIAGDSTVTDQPNEPFASWGQMLPRFFKADIAIANHAESGETLKSFVTGLRLDKLLSQMKRGDYLLMQFGHNDMKENWPQTYVEPSTTYKAYLSVFIAEARRRGATPVLVTPMQRRQFDGGGKIRNSLGGYPEAMRQLARDEKAALVDLNAMSVAFYEALGPGKAPFAFGNGGKDATHHSQYGAYELAKCVIEGIRSANIDLAQHIFADTPRFDPAHPDPPESWTLPLDPQFLRLPPRGN